jgi:hypothetical protein
MPGQSHINQSHLSSLQRITAPNATHSLQQSIPYRCAHGTGTQQSTIEAGLWDLAGLTPWIGGSAVYTARIILGYDPDEHGVPYRLKDTTRVLSRKQNVLGYPNPVTDVVQLKFSTETEGSSMFRLYDYTGKLVFEKEIYDNTKNTEINLNSVGKGLFMYSISGKNLSVTGKLIKY